MQFWVGVTDGDWFERLAQAQADEVNFWQPSHKPLPMFLQPGSPFLFKLHSPRNFIVGGGFFVRSTELPVSLAWEAFETKNGVANLDELVARLAKYRRQAADSRAKIRCNVLAEPFFFPREAWIPVPESWSRNIVRGKTYDTAGAEGHNLWASVTERLQPIARSSELDTQPLYGNEYLTRARLGQGAFRVLVVDAYSRRCAISGERTLPTLEAAHIKFFSQGGPHRTDNGLLLRSDLHKLFDERYLTISVDHRVLVSNRIREEFENGKEYYRFHGQPLASLPGDPAERPFPQFLEWHNERFLG